MGKGMVYTALGVLVLLAATQKGTGARTKVVAQPLGADLASLEVKGASRPGGRCEVRVQSPTELWLSLPAEPCRWAQGDRIEVSAELLDRWAQRQGARPQRLWVNHYIGHRRHRPGFWAALAKWRSWLFVACQTNPGANFVLASLSGIPSVLRRARLNWLREAGLGHLTAVSGLHVGTLAQVVGWGILRCLGIFRTPRWPWARVDPGHLLATMLCAVPLLCFVMATGAAASACRALLCWGVWALAGSFGLRLHRLSMLLWIAAGMLAYRPAWWGDPGFYFSFVATGILLWPEQRPQSEDPSAKASGWPGARFVVRTLLEHSSWSTSWRLSWALAPLSLWFFKKASLVAVLANLVAIPVFAAWVLPIGLFAVALAALSEVLGCALWAHELVVGLFFLAGLGGSVILDLAQGLSGFVSGTSSHWALISAWLLVVYPTKGPLSPLHPLAFAPRPLLWVLVSAPLWTG